MTNSIKKSTVFKGFLALSLLAMIGCGKKEDTTENNENKEPVITENTPTEEPEEEPFTGLNIVDSVVVDENGEVTEQPAGGENASGSQSSSGNSSQSQSGSGETSQSGNSGSGSESSGTGSENSGSGSGSDNQGGGESSGSEQGSGSSEGGGTDTEVDDGAVGTGGL